MKKEAKLYKKFFIIATIVTLLSSTIITLTACENTVKATKVSTAEEFIATRGAISLNNDIDLNYATLDVMNSGQKIVYGNGHKLSNCIVSTGGNYGVFGLGTTDVTIENFDVTVIHAISFGFVAPSINYSWRRKNLVEVENYYDAEVSEVHIKNCKVDLELEANRENNIGGLIGFSDNGGSTIQSDSAINITNCSVDNLQMTAHTKTLSSVWDIAKPIYFGGMVGNGDYIKMENCHVKDCNFTTTAGGMDDKIRMGGLIGYMQNGSELLHCSVQNTKVEAQAKVASNLDIAGQRVTATTRVGGITGSSETNTAINACFCADNELICRSSGGGYLGGLVGVANCPVTQSYAVGNKLTFSDRRTDDGSQVEIKIGGIAGAVNSVMVSSSFAIDNEVNIALKNVNKKYFYLTDYGISACKTFMDEFFKQHFTSTKEIDDYITNIENNYNVDKETMQSFINGVKKINFTNELELKNYLDSYYRRVQSEFKTIDNISVGGIAGTIAKDALIQRCAAGIFATDCHPDWFSKSILSNSTTFDNKINYILQEGTAKNRNDCKVLNREELKGDLLKNKLQLTDEKWVFINDKFPILSL